MRNLLRAAAALALVMGIILFAYGDDPKHTIKEVMKTAHKDGLLKKVTSDKASKEEKEELVSLYKDLAANKPPKNDDEDWKTRTSAMVDAAEAVVKAEGADVKKAETKLGMTVKCMDCHSMHKGK
jgi:hypothetical protein